VVRDSVLILTLCVAVAMGCQACQGQEERPGPDPPRPAFDPGTLKPFTEGGLYLGKYETGLYPDGTNEMPEAHRHAGERIAATIRPLDARGKPDEEQGRILAVVFGHSNCAMYFAALGRHLQQRRDTLHPRFEMLNAAIGGNPRRHFAPHAGHPMGREGLSRNQPPGGSRPVPAGGSHPPHALNSPSNRRLSEAAD